MNSEILPKSITGGVVINYYECNIDSIWISCIIVIIMILFIIFLKIILYSEIYKIHQVCHPIPFFFGESNSCKQLIYSVKSKQLKEIAEIKSRQDEIARDEENARDEKKGIEYRRDIINKIKIYKAKKRIEKIIQQRENESCDNVNVEDFRNQSSSLSNINVIPVYILAMYKTININLVDCIEKIKNILYILFNEYVYPKLYRITH